MKVVHLLPALEQGGVETVVCDLVRALDCESVVISRGGRMVERVEKAGGRHLVLDLKSKNPLTYFSRALKLRRILRAEKPDLVCAHSRVPAWLFVWANRGLGLKWITYAHGANSVSRYSAVMTKGDLVVTPSRFMADFLRRSYGTDEGKIRVVPNAVDTERFDPAKLDHAFIEEKRREWGIQEGDYVLMALGRITPVKGLEELIRNLGSQISDFKLKTGRCLKLVIVGGADKHHLKYLEHLKTLSAELLGQSNFDKTHTSHLIPHTSSVVFAGPQSKIPECLSIADEVVSANTTKPESFGLSIVEAYAMNRPVRLARRFGGAAEVAEAVEKAGCATFREAVLKLYGYDVFAQRTLAVYRELNMI